MEEVNRMIQFFFYVYDRVISFAKKTYIKDKVEESWLENGTGENKNKVKV